MIAKVVRFFAAVVLTLGLLATAQTAVCKASIFNPVSSVTKTATKTTKKVANTSVAVVKTVVARQRIC